ncbi:hypothetical protein AMECASPLE_031667 [Ameca splendens]|uniref:Uncharacterized protein n=1 Tax=Ameca splendens TaxID=208324 RepID=A0ABV0XVC6_9TELE
MESHQVLITVETLLNSLIKLRAQQHVLLGCDELGNHTSGPPEKDHEQHTDYESPDAASSRYRCPGVTSCDGTPGSGQEHSSRTYLEQRLGRTRHHGQSTRTSAVSDSCCVWREIIPLFLGQGMMSVSSKGTKEKKRARNSNKKQLPV